jgi:hypothetical protein
MAYIRNRIFKIGDKVRLVRDVSVIAGTFTKGHIMEITDCADRRGWDLADEDGNRLLETQSDNFELV